MARLYPARGLTALVAILCLGACEAAKSANPTAPSVAGPIPGVSITAPKPLEPGAVMWVPPYERHQIKNTGPSTMKFICCVPQKKP